MKRPFDEGDDEFPALNLRTLAIALFFVFMASLISSFFPMGFAP